MAMDDQNPYEAPRIIDTAVGVKSGRREDLRQVAVAQKGILICILIYFFCGIGQFLIPPQMMILLGVIIIGCILVAFVFVILLAMRVYSTGMGIVFGVLTLVPCVGLIVLLIINSKATNILRSNGISVGLLGANMAQLPRT
jgi:hypothetical protein